MNSFQQIKTLLELKEKGAISEAEFKQMMAIVEAKAPTKQGDIQALREKELLEQIQVAYQNKDWKTLRAKFELLNDKSLVSLEISTALFAYERQKTWILKEEQAKRVAEKRTLDAKRKKIKLAAAIGTAAIIVALIGLVFKDQKNNKVSKSIQTNEHAHYPPQQKPTLTIDTLDSPNNYDTIVSQKQIIESSANKKIEIKNKPIGEENRITPKTDEQLPEQKQIKPDITEEASMYAFPERLLMEAKVLKQSILNTSTSNYDKIMAASRIKAICREYNAGLNKKWPADINVSKELTRCYNIADNYN